MYKPHFPYKFILNAPKLTIPKHMMERFQFALIGVGTEMSEFF